MLAFKTSQDTCFPEYTLEKRKTAFPTPAFNSMSPSSGDLYFFPNSTILLNPYAPTTHFSSKYRRLHFN